MAKPSTAPPKRSDDAFDLDGWDDALPFEALDDASHSPSDTIPVPEQPPQKQPNPAPLPAQLSSDGLNNLEFDLQLPDDFGLEDNGSGW
jgi:hypothetical protein